MKLKFKHRGEAAFLKVEGLLIAIVAGSLLLMTWLLFGSGQAWLERLWIRCC